MRGFCLRFMSTSVNQQSAQPLCCAMDKAWTLGFHEGRWVGSWSGPETLSLSLIIVSEWHLPFLILQLNFFFFWHLIFLTYFSLSEDTSETVSHPLQENQRDSRAANHLCVQKPEQWLPRLLLQRRFRWEKSLLPGSIFLKQYWNLLWNQSKQMLDFILDIARSCFFISWGTKLQSKQSVSEIKHPHCTPCICLHTQLTTTTRHEHTAKVWFMTVRHGETDPLTPPNTPVRKPVWNMPKFQVI